MLQVHLLQLQLLVVVVSTGGGGGGGGGSYSAPVVTTVQTVASTGSAIIKKVIVKKTPIKKTPIKKATTTPSGNLEANTPVDAVLLKNLYTRSSRVNMYVAADSNKIYRVPRQECQKNCPRRKWYLDQVDLRSRMGKTCSIPSPK